MSAIFISIIVSGNVFAGNAGEPEEKLRRAKGTEKIELLNRLAKEHRRKSPEKCIDYGNRALELARELEETKGEAAALANIGAGYSYSGKPRESIKYFKKALACYERLHDKKGMAGSLNSIGGNYIRANDLDRALDYLQRAVTLHKETGDKKGLAGSLGNIGVVYQKRGDNVNALDYHLESLEAREALGDKRGTAASSNNIGILYAMLNKNEQSLTYFLKALKIKEELGDPLGVAASMDNIGIIHKQMGDYGKALEYHGKALRIREEKDDKKGVAQSFGNLGMIHEKQGNDSLALSYHQRALNIYEEIGDKMGVALTLNGLGVIYTKLGRYDQAASSFEGALKIAGEMKARMLIKEIYGNLSQSHAARGDYKKALEYHRLFFEMSEKILNENTAKRLLELQTRYNTLKKEKRIELLEKNNRIQEMQISRETVTRNAFIAGFVLVLIILALLFKKYLYLFAFWKKQKYVGPFRLMEKIGSGGMGVVYKAHHVKDRSETYAVKVLREELSESPDDIKRFKQEATIIDKLDHANIVKIIERGQYKQRFFIAMELLEGKTLETKLSEDGPLPLSRCLHIMAQIAGALSLIHAKHVIHRDLKPSNIMLISIDEDDHFVKLLDFGVARLRFQTKLTKTGILVGTTSYLSPEQITGSEVSSASDVFSLGVIFYRMACGQKPFVGENESDIIKEILEKEPPEPRQMRDDIPGRLNALILKMLAKPKEQRPTSAEVLSETKTLLEWKLGGGQDTR
jgi:tetratricopeptide (TPR) repeat protein